MSKIPYKYFPPQAILDNPLKLQNSVKNCAAAGGLNLDTKEFTPLDLTKVNFFTAQGNDEVYASSVFDVISAAVEMGLVDQDGWHQQLFANSDSFLLLIDTIDEYEDFFKFEEPWRQAFIALIDGVGDTPHLPAEGYNTAAQIADRLRECLADFDEW